MSIDAVQARIAEISARLAELRPAPSGAAIAPGGVTSAPGATASSAAEGVDAAPSDFTGELRKLLGTARPAGTSSAAAPSAAASASPAPDLAQRVLASARQHLGVPYLWGGTTPKGFDCSGFVQYVFAQHGVSLPRVSKDQARAGVAVSAADARPGDLVAFDNSRSRAGIDHIGIYLGDGRWIAAPRTGDVVKIQDVDLSRAAAIRRVLPSATVRAAGVGTGPESLSTAWASLLPPAGQPYASAFSAAEQATGVDARLLAAVAWTESGFDAGAVSGAGARGLMQIMPSTARGLGVDATDPRQAALGAARYLAENLHKFDGRTDLALAAYNAGPAAVRKHGGIPPYAETQAYVARVLDRYTTLGGHP